MIKVFSQGTVDFSTNGLGALSKVIGIPIVTRELNGMYEATISVDHTEPLLAVLKNEAILLIDTPNNAQPFTIYQVKPSLKSVTLIGKHLILSKLSRNFIEDTNIQNRTATAALDQILTKSLKGTDSINVGGNYNTVASARLVRKNLDEAIFSDETNSFLSRWGGEFDFDRLTLSINSKIGTEKPYTIEYAKNLLGFEATIDSSQIITKVMPQGFDGLFLEEKYVACPNYEQISSEIDSIAKFEFDDVISDDSAFASGKGMPRAEALDLLRSKAQELFDIQEIHKPKVKVNVNFIELSETEQYKNFKDLERLRIGDSVSFKHQNFDVRLRMVGYDYNPITNRYISIRLGSVSTALISHFQVINKVSQTIDKIKEAQPSLIEKATKASSDLIKNGFGGYVRYYPDRILIMDNEDEANAKNIWQYNKNGLGFSSTGINGEFETAITSDGSIVANFINSGILNAGIIKAGTLTSADGSTWFDFENNSFSFADGALTYSPERGLLFLTVTDGGGANLLKNSVGYAGSKFWETNSVGVSSQSSTWILENSTSKHGFKLVPQEQVDVTLSQKIQLKRETDYTINFKVNREPDVNTLLVTLVNDNNEVIEVLNNSAMTECSQQHKLTFNTGKDSSWTLKISLSNGGSKTVEISDIGIYEGRNVSTWQQNAGETYTLNIQQDSEGISIFSFDGKSKTVMSPHEFAGYYNDKRIFTLNGDLTQIQALEIMGGGLLIRPIKIIQNRVRNALIDVWVGW